VLHFAPEFTVNLIAAALHQGKRVLFVAEKAAALDVVAKRLESVGLGEFCMDLHGPGARRDEVLKDLKTRIDASAGPGNAARLKQALDEANRLKASLTAYATAINSEHGSLGLTVHDIIWKEQATRKIDLPTAIDDVTLDDAASITPYAVDEAHDLLNRIAAADQSFRSDHGSPDAHPWRPIGETSIPQHQRQNLVRLAGAWREALEALIETEAGWRAINIDPPASLAALRTAVQGAAQLPAPDPAVEASLFTTLDTPEAQSKLREYLEAADQRTNALSVLAAAFKDVEAVKAQNGLAPLAAALESLIGEKPVSVLNGIEHRRLAEAAAWDGVTDHARQFIQAIGVEAPGNSATAGALRRALTAAAILRETSSAALPWRLSIAGDRDAAAAIQKALAERDVILANKKELEAETGISLDQLGDAQAIAADQASCRSAGFMAGLFDSNFKAARLRARGAGCVATDKTALADAFGKALACRKQETAFTNDPAYTRQLNTAFQGMETDFEGLLAAAALGDAVLAEFGGFEHEVAHARETLLSTESGRFADIRNAAHGPAFDDLQQPAEALKAAKPTTPLADISDNMRQDAAHTAGFIQCVQEISLRPEATPAMLAYAAQAQPVLIQAERTMAPESTFGGLVPDLPALQATAAQAEAVLAALAEVPALLSVVFRGDYASARESMLNAAKQTATAMDHESRQRQALDEAGFTANTLFDKKLRHVHPSALARAAEATERSGEAGLDGWIAFRRNLVDVDKAGLMPVVQAFQTEQRPMTALSRAYDRALYRSLMHDAMATHPALADHSGAQASDIRKRFQKADIEAQKLTAAVIAANLSLQKGPSGNAVGKVGTKTERGLIEHYAPQKKPRVPLRRLFAKAPKAVQALKPCLMLSPATVAEVLTPGAMTFDLLVIDEASQMKPEFAMGALARSAKAVIVGDEMQLPPTDFFNRSRDDGDDSDDEDAADAVRHESILALANATLKPERQLLWHYWSRHESLIAYSNQQFYDEKLVVFPAARAPSGGKLGVSFERIEGAKYTPGSRVNTD
jgi:hypothetical protein